MLRQLYHPKRRIAGTKNDLRKQWLHKCLTECKTGQNRIPAQLTLLTIIGHKTGTGGKNSQRLYRGINDIGFIEQPNDKPILIAIFCNESKMTVENTESVIAKMAYYSVSKKHE